VDNDQIIAGFRSLRASDFDLNDVESSGMERLYELTDAALELNEPGTLMPEMFQLMERLPEEDLGSPGPLVHTLEAMPGYEPYLSESMRRKPSSLSVWMVNRILNSSVSADRRVVWLALLEKATEDPEIPESVRRDARDFLTLQLRKG